MQESCQDGKRGPDGDCTKVCSEGYNLVFENNSANTGRAACCKPEEIVAPNGACKKPGAAGRPDLCYRLKGRLVRNVFPGGETSFIFLRGFEGDIEGIPFRCDNNGCCSNSDKVVESFAKCGLTLNVLEPGTDRKTITQLNLSASCSIYFLADGAKVNFDMANPTPYYGGFFSS